jgi:hypothetical protein
MRAGRSGCSGALCGFRRLAASLDGFHRARRAADGPAGFPANHGFTAGLGRCKPGGSHMIVHNVYFWLKTDLTAQQRATFETELLKLAKIPYLAGGSVGKPAPTEARPVTDHSFDYTSSLQFKTMADHEHYQRDCAFHQRFVEVCKPMFERVVVYDNTPIGS